MFAAESAGGRRVADSLVASPVCPVRKVNLTWKMASSHLVFLIDTTETRRLDRPVMRSVRSRTRTAFTAAIRANSWRV